MSHSPSHPPVAYIEDYNEDAHTTLPETRQTANIAAKRSKPDIAKLKLAQSGRDEPSDTGYSNHSIATRRSVDSSLEPKSGNLRLKVNTAVAGAITKSRSAEGERKATSPPKNTTRPSLRRTESKVKSRNGEVMQQRNCTCKECQTMAKPPARSPEKSSKPDPVPKDQPAKQKPQAPVPSQSSIPAGKRPNVDIPIIQPAQARPRPISAQAYRGSRPVSYHSGAMPEYFYTQPICIERRPGTAFAPGVSFPPPSYPPPKPVYFPPPLQPLPPRQEVSPIMPYIYDPRLQTHLPSHPQPRPQPRQWTSDQSAPLPQPLIYSSSPILEYPRQPNYPGLNPSSQPTLRHSFNLHERPAPVREEQFVREDYYHQMPPPPRVPVPLQEYRPAIKHSTTAGAHPTLHRRQSKRSEENIELYSGGRSPRKSSPEKRDPPSRPPLTSRLSMASNHDRSTNNYPIDRGTARVRIENNATAKQRRRASVYGGEMHRDLERVVEAYQSSKNADAGLPISDITADSLKMVRKKTQSSDSGSRRSGEGRGSREGSEIKPPNSSDRRGGSDVKSRTENDGITMRLPKGKGINVDLKGSGVEGRTISLRQIGQGEGGMELSIGARGGTDGSREESGERSRRRYTVIDDGGVKELEYARTVGRASRYEKEIEHGRDKERRVTESRSRRSSRSGSYRDAGRMF